MTRIDIATSEVWAMGISCNRRDNAAQTCKMRRDTVLSTREHTLAHTSQGATMWRMLEIYRKRSKGAQTGEPNAGDPTNRPT